MDDQGTNRKGGGVRCRKLRTAWSVGWGVACLLLIALWVRSHWWCDLLAYTKGQTYVAVAAGRGIACFRWTTWQPSVTVGNKLGWELLGGPPETAASNLKPLEWRQTKHPSMVSDLLISFPCWFCVTFFATLAAAPWLHWRFSLRTLLIAITLVAGGLGSTCSGIDLSSVHLATTPMDDQGTTGTSGRKRFRKLRIAWSVAGGVVCLLLIALWVRSYPNTCDQCWGHFPNGTGFEVDSHAGSVWVGILYGRRVIPFQFKTFELQEGGMAFLRSKPTFRFMEPLKGGRGSCVFSSPHWFLVLLACLVAGTPWLRWRFSLRTLLIVVTLVAVVLGLVVW